MTYPSDDERERLVRLAHGAYRSAAPVRWRIQHEDTLDEVQRTVWGAAVAAVARDVRAGTMRDVLERLRRHDGYRIGGAAVLHPEQGEARLSNQAEDVRAMLREMGETP